MPVQAGMKSGEGGLSRKASVWQSTSASSTRSLSSSRYSSVCTSTCLRPSTGSGDLGRSWSLARFLAIARRLFSCCRWISMGSGWALCGSRRSKLHFKTINLVTYLFLLFNYLMTHSTHFINGYISTGNTPQQASAHITGQGLHLNYSIYYIIFPFKLLGWQIKKKKFRFRFWLLQWTNPSDFCVALALRVKHWGFLQ